MKISEMAEAVHGNAREHGWWDVPRVGGVLREPEIIAAKLALIHSEVSTALEEIRSRDAQVAVLRWDGKPEGFGSELADVVIRVFDLAEACGVDIEAAIIEKHSYNRTRPFRHGGRRL